MNFNNWYILFGLFIPASLLIWTWMRNDNRTVLPQDHGTQRRGRFWHFTLNGFQSLGPLVLAVAILLLAGPRHLSVPKSKREVKNIEFCLDLSGSMGVPFESGSRYDAAMKAIIDFVELREGDAFGLTVFGDEPHQWIPLTTDASAFRCSVPFLDPRKGLPPSYGGGTRIGLALKECRDVLVNKESGDRMIILVSDGQSADLGGNQDREIAQQLRDENIIVYGIHIGGGEAPPEIGVITNITGGHTFAPDDSAGLSAVFKRIDGMQVAKLEQTFAELLDNFWIFAVVGLSMLGGVVLSMLGLRFTPW